MLKNFEDKNKNKTKIVYLSDRSLKKIINHFKLILNRFNKNNVLDIKAFLEMYLHM